MIRKIVNGMAHNSEKQCRFLIYYDDNNNNHNRISDLTGILFHNREVLCELSTRNPAVLTEQSVLFVNSSGQIMV
jgi:hypothetical protein